MEREVNVGPRTPWCDVSLKTVTTLHPLRSRTLEGMGTGASLDGATVETVPMDWSEGPCIHKWPLVN